MIYGLENNYYCAHTPIPVRITPIRPEWGNMYARVTDGFSLSYESRLYKIDDYYYIDLSPWVKMLMNPLEDNRYYYRTGVIETINEQLKTVDIYFTESNNDENDPQVETQYIQKIFVQCALYTQPFAYSYGRNIKIWKGYPYSFHFAPNMEQSFYAFSDSDVAPVFSDVVLREYIIEYENKVCKGSYLKWLNEWGGYYYWYFNSGREESAEGENILDVPRSTFDANQNSNYDTVGFDGTDKFTVRDMVKKEYWHLFKSLATSPEVYILKDGWIDSFLAGATTLTPDWWMKVRQLDFDFERTLFSRSMAEVEIELEYPKPYSQKRI